MIKPLYINPEKEKDLLAFLEQHGTKRAINMLFDLYRHFDRFERIDTKPKPTVLSGFNFEDDFIANF